MSIVFDGGCYWLNCDNCSENEELSAFKEAVKFKKDHGWKSVLIDNEWQDRCPDCVEQNEDK